MSWVADSGGGSEAGLTAHCVFSSFAVSFSAGLMLVSLCPGLGTSGLLQGRVDTGFVMKPCSFAHTVVLFFCLLFLEKQHY